MIGCNSTDEELDAFERELAQERVRRIKELEDENQSLREEIRILEGEKLSLESRIDRLEDEMQNEDY